MKALLAGEYIAALAEPIRGAVATPWEILALPDDGEEHLRAALPAADALVTSWFSVALAPHAQRLRLIQVFGAGYERVELAAVPPGCSVCNCFEHEHGIAEYVIMAMLVLSRDLLQLDRGLRQGAWLHSWAWGGAPRPELRGRTLGIVGLGRIGQATARLARAFGMTVVGTKGRPEPALAEELGLAFLGGPGDLAVVLRQSDFLLLSAPLGPATRGMIGEPELAMLPRGAVLINVARARLVDEAALYAALASGHLGGAALDVWYVYPRRGERRLPATFPFHELPNVLLTPHIAGWTTGTIEGRVREVAAQLDRLARGEPLQNVVWPRAQPRA